MHWFTYKNDRLHAEGIPLDAVAERFGTPTFVYSLTTLERHISTIDGAFDGIDHLTCFSVKANSNGTILKLLAEKGLGADIVSGGELFRALRAGIPGDKIVYSGVGKTEAEIGYALDSGILMFNVESETELYTIDRIARGKGVKAPISLRVNPDVDPKTHPYISTGLKKNKFGIPHEEARRLYRTAAGLANIEIIGIDAHIGSQLTDFSPYEEATQRLTGLITDIRKEGIELKYIDIGGGLGINYEGEFPPDPADWAAKIVPVIEGMGLTLIIEPGRSIVGNAGILLSRVINTKSNGDKTFVVVDAAMNDLVRPALYGSFHGILPVVRGKSAMRTVDIVGPICESSDFMAKEREIEMPEIGDLISIMSAGAYGMAMSSNFNSRLRAAEVMVSGADMRVIRARETYGDLVANEPE